MDTIIKNTISEIKNMDDFEKYYYIKKKIGSGTFSNVFKVVNKFNEESVLKIFKYSKYDFVYSDEIRILTKLKENINDNNFMIYQNYICKLINNFYFENEYIINYPLYGDNLYKTQSESFPKGFPMKNLKKYRNDILTGLNFIHSAGIIHRDLKPENIVFSRKNDFMSNLIIIDFGLSYDFHGVKSDKYNYYLQSRYYRAPEIIFHKNKSFSMDIWSIGCIFFELIFGKVLFPGKNENEMIQFFNLTIGKPPPYYYSSFVYKRKYNKNTKELIDIYGKNGFIFEENVSTISSIFQRFINRKRKKIRDFNKLLKDNNIKNQNKKYKSNEIIKKLNINNNDEINIIKESKENIIISNDTFEKDINKEEKNITQPIIQNTTQFQPKEDLNIDELLDYNYYKKLIEDCIIWNPIDRKTVKELYTKYVLL